VKRVVIFLTTVLIVMPVKTYGWVKTYGTGGADAGLQVQQITGGYFIFAGTHLDELPDLWLLKINPEGDTIWSHEFGYTAVDWGVAAYVTSDNGYILFENSNWPNFSIIRTDSAGNVLWSRDYMDRLLSSVYPTSDGGYILGQDEDTEGYCSIMKIDTLVDSIWCKGYEYGDIRHVEESSDNGLILTGGARNDGILWLLKVDSDGDTLWSKTCTNWEASYGNCVRQTSDEGYILTGSCVVGEVGRLLVFKTDSEGDMLWSYAADFESMAKCVHETEDGFLVAGRDSDARSALLVKLSKTGELVWEQRYGTRTNFNCMDLTNDGGIILTGSIHVEAENNDLFIVKTDSEGNPAVVEYPEPEIQYWKVATRIGREIILKYANHPQGFHASVFDASGRKVGEISSAKPSGTLKWGDGVLPGVYFIVPETGGCGRAQKVMLIR